MHRLRGRVRRGYFGEERMDLGPVDLRVAGGLVVGGYGLYNTMQGKGGSHALALGCGSSCLAACLAGGAAAGAWFGVRAASDPFRGEFVAAGALIAGLAGSLGCVYVGAAGVIGMFFAFAGAALPLAFARTVRA